MAQQNGPGAAGPDWNKIADFYNEFSFAEIEDAKLYLDAIDLRPEDTLLDVCSGPGRISVLAAERCWRVTAMDSAQRMLDYAAKNAEERGLSNIDFQLLDWAHVLPGQNLAVHDVVVASRCGAMIDVEKLTSLARRTVMVQIFADSPSIPELENVLFSGCGETAPMRVPGGPSGFAAGPMGASHGGAGGPGMTPGRPGMPPSGPGGPGAGGPGGPGMPPGGPGGPGGRRPSAYKQIIDKVYAAGFDPNVRILPERFRKRFATREEVDAWVCALDPKRTKGSEARVHANIEPFVREINGEDGESGVEFCIATAAAIIWWDVRGPARSNPWIMGVAE